MATTAAFLRQRAQRTAAAAAAAGLTNAGGAGGSSSSSQISGLVRRALSSASSSTPPHEGEGQQEQPGRQQQPPSTGASSSSKRPRPAAGAGVGHPPRQPLSTHAKRSSSSSFFEAGDDEERGGYHHHHHHTAQPQPRPHQQQQRRPPFYPTTAAPQVHVGVPAAAPAHEVIFVRHGQSTWNRSNRFIGWCDTPLTEQGLEEARTAGQILRRHNVGVDEVHTSLLKRSVKTACLILEELGLEHVPVRCHWRLNERSYGALVGLNKKECVAQHGAEQVKLWRRSFDVPPPPQDPNSRYYPGRDGRKYEALLASGGRIPLTECLRDVRARVAQHWEEAVLPSVRAGKRVVVVGHENNLRGLLMHLEGISEAAIPELEIPRAVPLRMQFDAHMRPVRLPNAAPLLSGQFLITQKEVEALQERDRRQVYDLNVRINLEEIDARHVMAALSGSSSNNPSSSSSSSSSKQLQQQSQSTPAKASTTTPSSSASHVNHRHHRTQYHQQPSSPQPPMAAAAFSTQAAAAAEGESAVGRLAEAARAAAWGALVEGKGEGKGAGPTTTVG